MLFLPQNQPVLCLSEAMAQTATAKTVPGLSVGESRKIFPTLPSSIRHVAASYMMSICLGYSSFESLSGNLFSGSRHIRNRCFQYWRITDVL